MDINHISVSRKGCFDLCQQQYKFKYHLKVETDVEEPFYFTYSKIVHRIAEKYVDYKGKKEIGEVANDVLLGKLLLDEYNNSFAPPLPPEYRKRFPSHIRSVKSLVDQMGFEGETEYKFTYDLDPPNGKNVTGVIDRLIIKNDKCFIVDYKTTKKGRWRKNSRTIKTDLQLRCYSKVVQKEFGIKAQNIKSALYYLEGADLIGACYSEDSLRRAEDDLLEVYNVIQQTNPDEVWGNVGDHCKRCDYRKICPFYSLT